MYNKLNEVPLARLDNKEIEKLKETERELGDKYYLIAFQKRKEI